mmetsp:Transcript_3617/g.10244  ORF Transcript_3617/g.10244 Transcript_3617/m.10244 type:complete len:131 (+) Transcript_3617:68-460(+)
MLRVITLLACALSVANASLVSSTRFPTRVIPSRWSPKVSAAALSSALEGTYTPSAARENEANLIIDELRRVSEYMHAMHHQHGDAFDGAHIAQERIDRAIKHVQNGLCRAQDHDGALVDDAAAAVYSDLW